MPSEERDTNASWIAGHAPAKNRRGESLPSAAVFAIVKDLEVVPDVLPEQSLKPFELYAAKGYF